jgi:hypothetical protein
MLRVATRPLPQAVVSDKPSCSGVAYAVSHNTPTLTYPAPKSGAYPGLSPSELVQQLVAEHRVQYVLLAGYLRVRAAAAACHCCGTPTAWTPPGAGAGVRNGSAVMPPAAGLWWVLQLHRPAAMQTLCLLHSSSSSACRQVMPSRQPCLPSAACLARSRPLTWPLPRPAAHPCGSGEGLPPPHAQHPPGPAAFLWWQGLLRREGAPGGDQVGVQVGCALGCWVPGHCWGYFWGYFWGIAGGISGALLGVLLGHLEACVPIGSGIEACSPACPALHPS